jgi:AcrR family transcriptional regulator
MTDRKRPYRKKLRAQLEERTRQRITQSALELHGTLGPSRTSLSAIAEHAGVRRSTLYRHFPDEATLFAACTAHWLAANPAPELESWAAIDDPDQRLRIALRELYAHYRRTEQMMTNILRDEETMPVVKDMFAGFRAYLKRAGETLTRGRHLRGGEGTRARAATGHALAFTTWRSLALDQGLNDSQAADLMCQLITAAAATNNRRASRAPSNTRPRA